MTVTTIDLDDAAWAAERDAVTQRYFGIDAAEFVTRYQDGEYAEADTVMTVLAYFPELD